VTLTAPDTYQLRFSNIDSEFRLEGGEKSDGWTATVESEEEFCRLLNCVAIATSEMTAVDFPEVEITRGTRRAKVTSVGGELFYSDFNSTSRQNLKVVPVEVIRLLKNLPLSEVFAETEKPRPETTPRVRYRASRMSGGWRAGLLAGCFVIMLVCVNSIWRELTDKPRLFEEPDYDALPDARAESMLAEWSGVYVSEFREGAMAVELNRDGSFRVFEMWSAEAGNNFDLATIRSGLCRPAVREGAEVFILNGTHVLAPFGEASLRLHGIVFHRFFEPLSEIGEVVS